MTRRKVLSVTGAIAGLAVIGHLIYEYDLLATVGKFVFKWIAQAWEFLVRVFELVWRPLLSIVESIMRSAIMRPFTKVFAWLGAGYVLRYLLHPNVGRTYGAVTACVAEYGRRVGEVWGKIPFWIRIALIVCISTALLLTHAQLLLLPLGFVLEPVVRAVVRWAAHQRFEKTSLWSRFKRACYLYTRAAMRKSALFRAFLGPLRALRLKGIRESRAIHFSRKRRLYQREN